MTRRVQAKVDTVRALRRSREIARMHNEATRAELDAMQQRRLRALVAHATTRSPFYARRLRGADLDAPGLLQRLPTLDKATLVEHLPDLLTDPRLRAIDLGAHVDALRGDELLLDEYRVMASGGTTGVRGIYVYDRDAWVETLAGMAAVSVWLGVPPRLPRPRMATIWAAGPAHMTARIASSFKTPAFKRLQLTAMMPIAEMVAALNAFRPDWLATYPSIAALLADEQKAGRLQIAPRVVMVTSEQCTAAMRARVADAWGSQPFNAYAATETSGIALECEAHAGLHVLERQVIVEVVDEGHRPVPDGTPGARVLVTNLANRVQPIIRFELTDMVTIASEPCPCGRAARRIAAIDGRTDDIMRLPDRTGREVPVHPNHFAEAIESVAAVRAYQVTELRDAVEIAVVATGDEVADEVLARVRANLEPLGVAATPVRVVAVERIARPEGASGKFKLVQARRRSPGAPERAAASRAAGAAPAAG